jgi:hypothetical protein
MVEWSEVRYLDNSGVGWSLGLRVLSVWLFLLGGLFAFARALQEAL